VGWEENLAFHMLAECDGTGASWDKKLLRRLVNEIISVKDVKIQAENC
jgi:hypothetical protein